jgi:GNAT superfamily N-acetyltransferase
LPDVWTERNCRDRLPNHLNVTTVSPMSTARPGIKPVAISTLPPITVRLIRPSDSMEELTNLLHRAYRAQVQMGLQPLAGRQDVETTKKRSLAGECYLAFDEAGSQAPRIVGTILFHEVEDAKGPPWFQRKDVDSFSQFGVDPDLQGRGIGQRLLEMVERRAVECGAKELGLSMAEPDTGLMAFYKRRGYRFVEHWQWPYTNYRSAILSKQL